MEQKTVFLSYRRALSKHLARAIYQDLRMNGWDVFLDVNTIDSGDFDRIILNQISARAHFILLISKGSLQRCANSGDWVLREIEEAVRLNRNIVPIVEEETNFNAEMAYLPETLGAIISKKNALPLPHFYFEDGMDKLRTRFLKTPEYVMIQETPTEERAEVQRRLDVLETETTTPVVSPPTPKFTLPQPFAWIDIPNKNYAISKYPITNAQFAEFIKADGYKNKGWWTEQGWEVHGEKEWVEPRFWGNNQWNNEWNGNNQPIVGVSWFEAVAFCLWMSEVTGDNTMLPTEDQWQYAAQGDDGRTYPWGNDWDSLRCHNSVDGEWGSAGNTSPVTQYEGKGDSPFGVVDMAGNVWEWCLTDYEDGRNNVNNNANNRMLRGGSWNDGSARSFRADARLWYDPYYWLTNLGFRVFRS